MGGIGSLISADLQDDLGNGILFSICAGLVIIMFGSVIYVKKNQTKWQEQRQNTVID
jgi:hypothetical protein